MRPRVLKRAVAMLACAAVTMTFAACESTEHESAQIERESRAARAAEVHKEQAAKQRSRGRTRGGRSHTTRAGAHGAAVSG
ncbi:MAG TPA: hypothetical protein VK707_09120 [Solirubrobacteraceae bacterium]|jgi:hypothetical protein|nr:hypothetical protein [Solirubrobacteraceae bacterium]